MPKNTLTVKQLRKILKMYRGDLPVKFCLAALDFAEIKGKDLIRDEVIFFPLNDSFVFYIL